MADYEVISFISGPGGVGKTTVATYLSWFLRKEDGIRNLLIDLDPSLGLTLKLMNFKTYYRDIEEEERTSADLLQATLDKTSIRWDLPQDFRKLVSRSRFVNLNLDFIASSIRLEKVMGDIWRGTTIGPGKKVKEALDFMPTTTDWNYVLIDVIPCYELKYSLSTLLASDICIVPLRVTVNDAGRTALILRELRKKSGLDKTEFTNKIIFLFSIVPYYKQDKIDTYKEELYKTFPGAQFFEKSIKKTVSFTRVGTDQQKSDDTNKVEEAFEPFYQEFKQTILS